MAAPAVCLLALGCSGAPSDPPPSPSPATTAAPAGARGRRLQAFGSQSELDAFLREVALAQVARRRANEGLQKMQSAPPATAAPAAEGQAGADKDESVTNVQHAGVDEGGIVKVSGDHLVVLRRGRLFTVRIGDDTLAPVSTVDAFGPDVDPSGAWYDEMLVSDGTVVVVGYSYQRGGTELGVFDLDADGTIRHRGTYHLRSNDYYSARNYASRLLGRRLVFYTPLYLAGDEAHLRRSLPALRKWRRDASEAEFRPIYTPRRIYRPLAMSATLALHTVTTCELGEPELRCTSSSVAGPPGRVFYVSPSAVYVWMMPWQHHGEEAAEPGSLLYRLPLDGGEPRALRVAGSPVDQFSFLEDGGRLHVLLRAEGRGDAMWASEATAGDIALLRLPLAEFGRDVRAAAPSAYRPLPKPKGHTLQNRFVGRYVLYGTGNGWGPASPGEGLLYAAHVDGGEAAALRVGHAVDRIEALGTDGLAVGADGRDLHFTPIALGERAAVRPRYTRAEASQGELRSHGFFYRAEGREEGLLGLPVRGGGRPGHEHLVHGSASILFLRNEALRLRELGTLAAREDRAPGDDGCRASCVDWYGNARPLFLRGRLFALLGYELVEGRLDEGRVLERRRIDMRPSPLSVSR
jgi:hypothetical protein